MAFRQENSLTDEQWDYIRLHLPFQPSAGRKRVNDRQIINGILYVLITGCQWRDMPRDSWSNKNQGWTQTSNKIKRSSSRFYLNSDIFVY
ncbi:transposase [Methanosarcina barkeri]|uniref:transposase n=1 Tax=Methanosarcina barkeri TaxID=2208 RepID=UPI0009B65152